ncbi:hypothetical protein HDV00_002683 [Rhizophlyctis rosea]|nr:hypothetical protein HDV00_002683 [Rhizophlyctis rosea]
MASIAPVTSVWALFFVVYYFVLVYHVGQARTSTKTSIGDGSVEIVVAQAQGKGEDEIERLREGHMTMLGAQRAHANFNEYVPLALILIFLLETSGASQIGIHILLAALLIARIAHAHFGLLRGRNDQPGRAIGVLGTALVMLAAGIWTFVEGVKTLKA